MEEIILSVEHITKHFGGLVALNDVSFCVRRGEVVGLMGPNGAGKTTLLNVIAGEYAPTHGRIMFKGKDITGLPPHKVCHLGIARTYQIPQPFVTLTARENLLVSSVFGRQRKMKNVSTEEDSILGLVDIIDKADTIAGNLPILLLKRLEIARALARKPEFLLLDEVAAGTSEVEIPKILHIIQEIRKMGVTVIIIEHVIKVLVNVVDRIVVLDKGVKIAEGEPQAIMCDNNVIEAYFGA